jgi:hypothetical protein
MNNKDQENGAPRGPLIFSVPASHFPFLVALNVGWFDVTERTAEEKRLAHNLTVAAAARFGDLRAS